MIDQNHWCPIVLIETKGFSVSSNIYHSSPFNLHNSANQKPGRRSLILTSSHCITGQTSRHLSTTTLLRVQKPPLNIFCITKRRTINLQKSVFVIIAFLSCWPFPLHYGTHERRWIEAMMILHGSEREN